MGDQHMFAHRSNFDLESPTLPNVCIRKFSSRCMAMGDQHMFVHRSNSDLESPTLPSAPEDFPILLHISRPIYQQCLTGKVSTQVSWLRPENLSKLSGMKGKISGEMPIWVRFCRTGKMPVLCLAHIMGRHTVTSGGPSYTSRSRSWVLWCYRGLEPRDGEHMWRWLLSTSNWFT